ncbi:TFIIS_C domain-containing protein/TFIIS_M domain-containing protein/Med26 domain-containing protein [Cephalotus follicularis]|uniref:Transcription elongation factor n=1 Tax=Cephalotus follicularis TaxID=3775 RepID=A0A1Q3CXG2_CEPFO|nr:TFIIS_C domain-containing protein/TFIIS_M domain-containing protein/Med26 domain-containing protein [Cephalotus follicularis]
MEKELVELFEAAKKAADAASTDGVSSGGPQVSRCVDAMTQLKNFPITYDILVSTQVGKRLRPLTKHPREEIQTMASDLLEIWKRIVIEETTRNKKNGTIDSKANTVKVEKLEKSSSMKVEKVSNTPSAKAEKLEKSSSIKVEKVSNTQSVKVEKIYKGESTRSESIKVEKAEKMDGGPTVKIEKSPPKLTTLIKSNDALRDKVREILVNAFSKVATEADEDQRDEVNLFDPIRVAVSVESTLFEKMGRSNGNQKFKYRSIIFNIKDPNNPDLRRKVLLGEVKPERLITMSPEEMASEQRQQENKEIKQKALFDCERGGQAQASTDQFKCGRCGQRKCTYYQMQTRSADEPMTTYVTCVNCNNRWKFC